MNEAQYQLTFQNKSRKKNCTRAKSQISFLMVTAMQDTRDIDFIIQSLIQLNWTREQKNFVRDLWSSGIINVETKDLEKLAKKTIVLSEKQKKQLIITIESLRTTRLVETLSSQSL